MVPVLISENMCLPKVPRGSLLADGRGRGDPERLAESKRHQRSDGTARAVAEIRRTTGTNPEEHRGRERPGERLRIEQRHRFSRFTGETRRSEHQVWILDDRVKISFYDFRPSSRQNSYISEMRTELWNLMTNPSSIENFSDITLLSGDNNESRGNIRAKYLLYDHFKDSRRFLSCVTLRKCRWYQDGDLKIRPTLWHLFLLPVLLRQTLNSGRNDINLFVCFRRWKVLQVAVDERYKLLSGFGKDGSTPGSQAFLASSVEPPWERALTPAKVPYYIK